ncbi:MAG: hypothetical protein M3X11_02395 [Acidobacteriota bacterium]|nr:hypothetical protein [Acidobacteriota bacterium]
MRKIRAITRRPLPIAHHKLRVFVHSDYLDYSAVTEAFRGVDACLFCLGISATQVSGEAEYREITHDFAVAAAEALKLHSSTAVFHFIGGRSTSLDSRFMWARVKAETERDLMALVNAVCWRPEYINGESSASGPNRPKLLKALRPLFRLLKPIRSTYVESQDIGWAMLQATIERARGRVIENAEIREIANRYGK